MEEKELELTSHLQALQDELETIKTVDPPSQVNKKILVIKQCIFLHTNLKKKCEVPDVMFKKQFRSSFI